MEATAGEHFPTVGDLVCIMPNPQGDAFITGVRARTSIFVRRSADKGKSGQAVAANFDYVFILSSLNQDLNLNRLERYLTLAWQSGGTPVVVLTKSDLEDCYETIADKVQALAVGVDVIAVSAHTGQGIDRLDKYLQPGSTIVLLGSSGVGKSSLVNRLAGEEMMAVNAIREDDARGRHTTTHRQMIHLPGGVMMIDTPGMRELGMWGVEADSGLGEAYQDIEELMGRCRFRDCGHTGEPGCAVLAALKEGALTPERWQRYQSLLREARYAEKKAWLMDRRAEKAREQESQRRKEKKRFADDDTGL